MINRLIEPTSGKIYIDGKDTDQFDPVELRRTIGYVIQQIGLFPNMTVEENICVVPKLLGWDMDKARSARRRAAGHHQSRAGDLPQALSEGALGRPAAARRCGPRAGRRSAGAADGRAVRRDRPDQSRSDPGRVPEDPPAPEEDRDVRQPRHRRSGEDGRQGRDLPRGQARAVRQPRHICSRIRPTTSSPISSAATARSSGCAWSRSQSAVRPRWRRA